MKAPAIAYHAAQSLADALGILAAPPGDVRLVAGGQSLVAALNLRLAAPDLLLDIGRLQELRGIQRVGDTLRIGALTRHADIARDALVQAALPMLPVICRHIAHPAIRNRGTLGGSLALADPAAEWPAAMLALQARFLLRSQAAERWVMAADFFQDVYETALRPDEILCAIEVPLPVENTRWAFDEFARRHGDFALAGMLLLAQVQDGRIAALNFGCLGLGRVPEAAPKTAAALLGLTLAEAADKVAALLAAELTPLADRHASADYRRHLAGLLGQRLLRHIANES